MSSRPTIVLVHGAFANAGCWAKLIPLLRSKGYSVVASNCPLSSLADDVAAVRLTIQMQDGPVLLVGHSWGSAVGVHMVKRQPALFSAFVGTGQLVNMRRNEQVNYQRYLEQAERRGDAQALRALRDLGPPPFTRPDGLKIVREWADRLADGDGDALQPRPMPMSLDFGRDDVPSLLQGMDYSRRALSGDLLGIDLTSLGLAFEVPMFCFHGACDQHTPVELAEQYFERISAPHKEFVRFDGCHHFVAINRPELFLQQLLARVQPWLEASS